MSKAARVGKLRDRLLAWGEQNTKEYPWRYEEDTYAVLVAEFMLQRTQANQVKGVYQVFMDAYPSLLQFIRGSREEVYDLLRPLGLRWRITGMVRALEELWGRYGRVPTTEDELKKISGIGEYIAGATICFSQNRPATLVDTNTVRVTGRVFGLDLSGEARRRKDVVTKIGEACDPERPRDYYYAMIDLAHEICTPKEPTCPECPLLDAPCYFGQAGAEDYAQEEGLA